MSSVCCDKSKYERPFYYHYTEKRPKKERLLYKAQAYVAVVACSDCKFYATLTQQLAFSKVVLYLYIQIHTFTKYFNTKYRRNTTCIGNTFVNTYSTIAVEL